MNGVEIRISMWPLRVCVCVCVPHNKEVLILPFIGHIISLASTCYCMLMTKGNPKGLVMLQLKFIYKIWSKVGLVPCHFANLCSRRGCWASSDVGTETRSGAIDTSCHPGESCHELCLLWSWKQAVVPWISSHPVKSCDYNSHDWSVTWPRYKRVLVKSQPFAVYTNDYRP